MVRAHGRISLHQILFVAAKVWKIFLSALVTLEAKLSFTVNAKNMKHNPTSSEALSSVHIANVNERLRRNWTLLWARNKQSQFTDLKYKTCNQTWRRERLGAITPFVGAC